METVRDLTDEEVDVLEGLSARRNVIMTNAQKAIAEIEGKLKVALAKISAEVEGGDIQVQDGKYVLVRPKKKGKKKR